MSTFIKIKRRLAGADPVAGDLQEGELAYAYTSDKLFIGGTGGTSVIEIGGNAFSDLLTATHGVATPDKAVILDSSTEIDVWNVVGQLEAGSLKTSATVSAGFVKNTASGLLLFGQTGEQVDLTLDNLADVTLTAEAAGEFLRYDGADWRNVLIVEADISNLQNYSLVGHTHLEADITDLQNYALVGHTHLEADITDLQSYVLPTDSVDILADVDTTTVAPIATDVLTWNGSNWAPAAAGAPGPHTHVEVDITDLQAYSLPGHTHVEADITDLQAYLLAEVNDLTAAVTWANVPDANVTQSSVTQHQAALSITESQISDLQSYALAVHTHVEADITDLQAYLTAEANDLTAAVVWANIPDANVPNSLTLTDVQDINSNTILDFAAIGSAVNYIRIHNQSAGNSPAISAQGSDSDVTLRLAAKGPNGKFMLQSTGTAAGLLGCDSSGNILFNQSAPAGSLAGLTDVTLTSPVQYEPLVKGATDWVNDTTILLDEIRVGNQPVVRFVDATGVGTYLLRVSTASTGNAGIILEGTNQAGSGNAGIQFQTIGSGVFRMLPGGSPPSAGFVKNTSAGDLQFGQGLGITDADVPNTLTLDEIRAGNQAVIRCKDQTGFATWLLKVGTGSTGDIGPRIIGSNQAESAGGLQIETESGTIRLLPNGIAPAAGFLGVNASGDILFNQSVTDSDVPNTLTLDNILDPGGSPTTGIFFKRGSQELLKVRQQSSVSGTNYIEIWSAGNVGVNASIRIGGAHAFSEGLDFHTQGSGTFSFLPGGSAPAAGLLGADSSGVLLFNQGVTDSDVPNILTLTDILAPWADAGLLIRSSGSSQELMRVRRHSNVAGTNYIEIWSAGNVGSNASIRIGGAHAFSEGLDFHTQGSGTFSFLPGGSAPAAGLLGVDASGVLLFNQGFNPTITSPVTYSPITYNGSIWVDSDRIFIEDVFDSSGDRVCQFWSGGAAGANHPVGTNDGNGNRLIIYNAPDQSAVGIKAHDPHTGASAAADFEFRTGNVGPSSGTLGDFYFLPGDAAPAAGAGFMKNDASGKVLFGQAGGGVTTLAALTDTIVPSPSLYEPLVWNGSADWVNDTRIRLTEVFGFAGDKVFEFAGNVGAANYIQVDSKVASHAVGPGFSSFGSDTNINLKLQAKGTGVVLVRLSDLDVDSGDVFVSSTNAYYWGPDANGSWRMIRSGADLLVQKKESGSWVTKTIHSA